MSQSSATKSTWGKFATLQAAQAAQQELKAAGIEPDKIVLESENFSAPKQLEDTEAIANLKTGAITGAVLGAIVGLSISLILTDFAHLGLAVLNNFQTIHYFSPIMGAIVGAAGIGLISGISGASVPDNESNNSVSSSKRHLVVVKGSLEDVALSREIIARQGGEVEEADRR